MKVTLSVVIPTLNEAAYLPGLLDALSRQTRPPDEIIVADARSTDGTAELAARHGARVVSGGMPSVGRNAGARAARGDVLLFLDADVLPPADFLERALDAFERGGYAVATCPIASVSDGFGDRVITEASNLYMQAVQPVSPRAPGFCIFACRGVHRAIGGFDESLKLCEDHDYVRRASQFGEFGVLAGVRIPVSMRRIEKEGLTRLALKYLWCEIYLWAGIPIRTMPFDYEFGAFPHAATSTKRSLVRVAEFRARLEQIENPVTYLRRAGLAELHPVDATRARLQMLSVTSRTRYSEVKHELARILRMH